MKSSMSGILKEKKHRLTAIMIHCISAIADTSGTFIINGNWMINWPGKYEVAGTTLFYERTGDAETIHTQGPTKEELHLNVRN